MRAATFTRFGGAEVLEAREIADPVPAAGEALVRMSAIGLNFADVYRRRGEYPVVPPRPYVLGYEGAGRLADGTRVAFADVPRANAELVAAPRAKLVALPDDISEDIAAALLLQGMTAHYLTIDSHRLLPGETIFVHAAAGGVGLLLTQIATLRGARVIAGVSSRRKAEAALEAGAESVVVTAEEDFVRRGRELTRGRGPDVVYDAQGDTLLGSLELVRSRGQVVYYGWAGGSPPAISPSLLMDQSKTLTGGDLWSHLEEPGSRAERASALFGWVREKKLRVRIAARFPLESAAAAHRFLESRAAIGKVLLEP